MRLSSILMVLFAIVLAVFAGVMSKKWLEKQRVAQLPQQTVEKPVSVGKLLVAAQPLSFGTQLTPALVKEIDWPSLAVPPGALTTLADISAEGQPRVVLSSIQTNEPILKSKITGAGQRATLSALIDKDMRAVTVRVNDVNGGAGFVLPGDRVDVMVTRTEEEKLGKLGRRLSTTFNDILLQNVKVLGVDQIADDRTEKPVVVKAVTLEVDPESAQKLALAANLGNISLVLRPSGSTETVASRRMTPSQLGGPIRLANREERPKPVALPATPIPASPPAPARAEPAPREISTEVWVFRETFAKPYKVDMEEAEQW